MVALMIVAGIIVIAVILYYSRDSSIQGPTVQRPAITEKEPWKTEIDQAALRRETERSLRAQQEEIKKREMKADSERKEIEAFRTSSRCVVCGRVASNVQQKQREVLVHYEGGDPFETYWWVEGFDQCHRCDKWHCDKHIHEGKCEACWRKELGGLVQC